MGSGTGEPIPRCCEVSDPRDVLGDDVGARNSGWHWLGSGTTPDYDCARRSVPVGHAPAPTPVELYRRRAIADHPSSPPTAGSQSGSPRERQPDTPGRPFPAITTPDPKRADQLPHAPIRHPRRFPQRARWWILGSVEGSVASCVDAAETAQLLSALGSMLFDSRPWPRSATMRVDDRDGGRGCDISRWRPITTAPWRRRGA